MIFHCQNLHESLYPTSTTHHRPSPPPPTSTANLRPPSPPTTHLHHHRSLLAIISHVILVLVQLIPRRHYLKILRELESRIRALRTRDTKELWQCVRNIPQFWGHLDKNKNNRIQNRHRPYPHTEIWDEIRNWIKYFFSVYGFISHLEMMRFMSK